MFLPKSKYKKIQAKPGEFITEDGDIYIGPAFTTYKGETYAGENPGQSKGKLVSSDSGKGVGVVKIPYAIKRVPTESEYQQGSMIRYFCQDMRTMKVVELLDSGYKAGLLDKSIPMNYATGSWILTGSLEDTKLNNYCVPGVKTINQKEINRLEDILPGISSSRVLCDPAQFVRNI